MFSHACPINMYAKNYIYDSNMYSIAYCVIIETDISYRTLIITAIDKDETSHFECYIMLRINNLQKLYTYNFLPYFLGVKSMVGTDFYAFQSGNEICAMFSNPIWRRSWSQTMSHNGL